MKKFSSKKLNIFMVVFLMFSFVFLTPQKINAGWDESINDLQKFLYKANKAYYTVDLVNESTKAVGNFPNKLRESKDNLTAMGNKVGIVSDEQVLSQVPEEDKQAFRDEVLSKMDVESKEREDELMAQYFLSNRSKFGGLGYSDTVEKNVAYKGFDQVVSNKYAQGLKDLTQSSQQLKSENKADRVQGAGKATETVGKIADSENMTKVGTTLNDTGVIAKDIQNFNNAEGVNKLFAASKVVDDIANFGEGLNYIPSQSGSGVYDSVTGGTSFDPNDVNNQFSFYPNDPQKAKNFERKLKNLGYTEEVLNQLMKQIPPQYQSAIRLAENIAGISKGRLVYPGKVSIDVKANPPNPLAGDQVSYQVAVKTTSKLLNVVPPKVIDAGIAEVVAKVEHPNYPTREVTLNGSSSDKNVINDMIFTANPYKEPGEYKVTIEAVDGIFKSSKVVFTQKARDKKQFITDPENNDGPKNKKDLEEVNNNPTQPDTGFIEYQPDDENNSWGLPNFATNNQPNLVGQNNNPYEMYLGQNNKDKNEDNVVSNTTEGLGNLLGVNKQNNNGEGSYSDILNRFGNDSNQNNENKKQNYVSNNQNPTGLQLMDEGEKISKQNKELVNFIKNNQNVINSNGFNNLNKSEQLQYSALAKDLGLVRDSRQFLKNNQNVSVPDQLLETIKEGINKYHTKQKLMNVNDKYNNRSLISGTYSSVSKGESININDIKFIAEPKGFSNNPNEINLGIGTDSNNTKNIQYIKFAKSNGRYEAFILNTDNRSGTGSNNSNWEKVEGVSLSVIEYQSVKNKIKPRN